MGIGDGDNLDTLGNGEMTRAMVLKEKVVQFLRKKPLT